jgi:hypothetical protein
LLLREVELVDEAPVAEGFFHCIEVGALEVFDEREDEHRLIVEVANDSSYLGPAEVRGSSQSPLAGDEFEPWGAGSDSDGLEQTVSLQRSLEFSQLFWLEFSTRLKRVGTYVGDTDVLQSTRV